MLDAKFVTHGAGEGGQPAVLYRINSKKNVIVKDFLTPFFIFSSQTIYLQNFVKLHYHFTIIILFILSILSLLIFIKSNTIPTVQLCPIIELSCPLFVCHK